MVLMDTKLRGFDRLCLGMLHTLPLLHTLKWLLKP